MIKKAPPLPLEHPQALLPWAQSFGWALVWLTASCAQAWAQSAAISASQLPQGGKVVAGTATIGQSGNNLNINQTSNRAVLNWNSFNVGAQAAVNFVQPSASSVTLNRVLDTQASQILGRINANGQVFLSNPNGVLFGPTAQVDVGGLLVTTHGIGNDDFMAGKSSFEGTGKAASVVNQGQLQASLGGYIALLAPQVRNEGVIVAKEGTVALAAGDKVTLQFAGQSLTAVQVDRAVVDALVDNQHLVRAEGGYVVMTARSANALLQNVVKNSGSVQTPSLVNRQGRIVLEGGSLGRVEVAGSLSATGDKGLSGGSVLVMGDQVQLSPGAAIDASGDTGGGRVLIGGGWPAAVGPVGKSSSLSVGDGVSIKAAATGAGNGGYIETSAQKLQIAAGARIDTSARNGTPGQWVIDPVDITIDDSLAGAISTALNSGDVTVSTDSGNTPDTSAGETAGTGNINVNGIISWSANLLTLKAADKLYINNVMRGSGSASLRFQMTAANGLDNIYIKAPVYLPAGDTLSALEGSSLTPINIKVITGLGAAGSTTGSDLQGVNGNLTGWYALGGDIDASATSSWNGGAGFSPLGYLFNTYRGTFIGLGHTVSNLYINRPATDHVGMFGIVERGASVTSLGLVNANITGATHVGAMAGVNSGTISVSFATGAVSGQSSVGGLVGTLGTTAFDGFVRNSYAKTTVNLSGTQDAGGLIGLMESGTVYKSYASGTINLSNGAATGVGGLIGRLGTSGANPTDVNNAGFWDTTLSGQTTSAAGTGLVTAATKRYNSGLEQFALNTDYWQNYYTKTTPLLKAFLTPLTINTGNDSKTYDGQAYTSNTLFSTSIPLSGSDPYFLGMGDFYYKEGSARISPVNAGSYSIVPDVYSTDNRGYNITVVDGTLTVNKADLSLVGNRAYNGSTAMAGANLTANGVNSETFSVSGAGADGNLSTRNVQAANLLASVSGLTLGTSSNGGSSSNYNALSTANSAVTITAKSVTLAAPVVSKTYDGTTAYTPSASDLTALSTQLGVTGDTVSAATMSFNNKNAGSGSKVVTASGATVSDGNSGLNYSLSYASNSTSTIAPKALTIAGITAADKVYDGLTTATVSTTGVTNSVLQANGLVAGDTVTVSATGNFRNAGNTANDKNAATNKTVALSSTYGGADVGNYAITNQSTTTASITPKALTISGITAADKVYDGLTTASVSTTGVTNAVLLANGLVEGDTVTVSATGNFRNAGNTTNDKNVGSGKTVLLSSTYGGADASNYTITNQSTTTASITPKALTISGITAADKVYDGLTTATVSTTGANIVAAMQSNGMVAGDTVTVSATGNFRNAGNTTNDKNVGSGKTVLLSSTYGGADVGNYAITNQSTTTASITPKALTISGITAADKVYDASSTATISTTGVTNSVLQANGLVAGDTVTVSATGNFRNAGNTANDKNAGNAKTVALSSTYGGADVGNYAITNQASTTASISALPLTVTGLSASDKSYDGSSTAMLTGTATITPISGDAVGLQNGQAQFTTTAEGSNLAVTASGFQLTGADANNYQLSQPTGLRASITPLDLTPLRLPLTPQVMATLNGSQVAGLSPDQVSYLSTEQFGALSAAQLANLSPAAWSRVSTTSVGNLTPAQIASLRADAWAYWLASQVRVLKPIQLQALTTTQLANWGTTQLQAMDNTQWQALTQLQRQNLTASQISAFSPSLVATWTTSNLNELTSTQLSGLTTAQITALSTAQVNAFTATQWQSWTPSQIAALTKTQIATLTPGNFAQWSTVQLGALNAAQVASLSLDQFNALNITQKRQLASSGQLQQWLANDLARVQDNITASSANNALAVNTTAPSSLSPNNVVSSSSASSTTRSVSRAAGLGAYVTYGASQDTQALMVVTSERQISQLSSQDVLSLQTSQIRLMSGAQLDTLVQNHGRSLLSSHWASLSAQQLATLSPRTWATLGREVLQNLSPQQISLITLEQVLAMSPAQLEWLTASQLVVFNRIALSALDANQFKALVSNKLSALPPQQIQALTQPQWISLSRSQIQSLTLQQIQLLSPAQLAALPPTLWQAFSVEQIHMLAPQSLARIGVNQLNIVLKHLLPHQIQALDSATLLQLEVRQLATLTPMQWTALTPNQIAAFSLVQLNALTPSQLQWLHPSALTLLSGPQLAALSPSLIASLTTVQWQSFSPVQLQALQNNQLASLSAAQLANLGPRVLLALSPAQLNGMSLAQLQVVQAANGTWPVLTMSPEQIASLSVPQVQGLGVASLVLLTPAQVAALQSRQLQALSLAQWQAMSPTQLAALNPAQMNSLSATVLRAWGLGQVAALTPQQVQAMSVTTLGALTPVQWQALSPTALAAMTAQQWNAMPIEQMAALTTVQLAGLPAPWLGQLRPAQIQALNLVQIGALTPVQMAALTPAQMQWLSPAQLSVINPQALTQFTPVQLNALTPVQVASFSPAQVNLLTPLQMRALAAPQLQALQPAQIVALQSLQLNALTPAQIQSLSALQLQALTPTQVVALNPAQLQALAPAQWNALRAENMAVLNTAQLQALSPALVAAFNPTQITALQPAQMGVLLPVQIEAMGTAQIWSLSNAQLQALTPAQIGAIRSVQLGTLLPLLRAEQIQGLSKTQLAGVNPNQLRQLTNAQTQAVLAVR